MTIAPPLPTLDNTLQQKWQRFIQTRLWEMDIHPTTWIAPTALIDRTWPKGIHIAANCVIDHHAVVLTHDMTRGIYLDTHIGENTRIGARAIIMPGVTVGKYCVVEPGSVVTRDIPDGIRVIGNPAKDISKL